MNNNIISNSQHSFVRGRSTCTNLLLESLNDWTISNTQDGCQNSVIMVALCNRETIYIFMLWFVLLLLLLLLMVALCNRADHYIFAL